jgi:hypothetical protein
MVTNPTFNLKTGADTDLYYAREVTNGDSVGKLKSSESGYKYPALTRTTGNSIKGSTESIESNELRKGRVKSAPRKGNSSSEGSVEFELSPITFDDFIAAAFRNEWKSWKSDTDSKINLDGVTYADGYLGTKCTADKTFGAKKLLGLVQDPDCEDNDKGLITIKDEATLSRCVVYELTCGETDIKYMLMKKFGGVEGEDIYQRFNHIAVNTFSLDVAVGAIVTGSFGILGTNDPKLEDTDEIKDNFGGVRADADVPGSGNDSFEDTDVTGKSFIENLPVKSTSTEQFTAREGFMYINGKNIEFANSLSIELNNGLEHKFAIFVPSAISTTPLTLDITGTIQSYLVKDGADDLFNAAVDDADNEILFTFQDNDEDPKYMYLFQIFKSKFTDHEASVSGADTIDVSYPFQSFEEKAVRMLRVVVSDIGTLTVSEDKSAVSFTPNYAVSSADIASNAPTVTFTATGGTAETVECDVTVVNGVVTCTRQSGTFDAGTVSVTWNTQSVTAEIA